MMDDDIQAERKAVFCRRHGLFRKDDEGKTTAAAKQCYNCVIETFAKQQSVHEATPYTEAYARSGVFLPLCA